MYIAACIVHVCYVTIVHILVLQSDSGFGSECTSHAQLVSNVGECMQHPVCVEPTKQLGEIHGLLQNIQKGLISGWFRSVYNSRFEIQSTGP